MKIPRITNDPGFLAADEQSYSLAFLKEMYDGETVSHILQYNSTKNSEKDKGKFIENRLRISISGAQEKLSLLKATGELRLTNIGEQGAYILKPIPGSLKNVDQVPANEHLTMQIAAQVYSISTAVNGLVFLKDRTPAYITRRFDLKPDGTKWGVEDFASLAGKSVDTAGADYKYNYSYEEMGSLLQKFVPDQPTEVERYFAIVVFNYLFSNGDAHLKNFALLESADGRYRLSPAYDLVNTRIHVDDSDFALDNGLFADDFQSRAFKATYKRGKEDFLELAKRIGITTRKAEVLLAPFLVRQPAVSQLIKRSFLDEKTKRAYEMHYSTKRNALNKE